MTTTCTELQPMQLFITVQITAKKCSELVCNKSASEAGMIGPAGLQFRIAKFMKIDRKFPECSPVVASHAVHQKFSMWHLQDLNLPVLQNDTHQTAFWLEASLRNLDFAASCGAHRRLGQLEA